jgi:hypothetical protein
LFHPIAVRWDWGWKKTKKFLALLFFMVSIAFHAYDAYTVSSEIMNPAPEIEQVHKSKKEVRMIKKHVEPAKTKTTPRKQSSSSPTCHSL